MVPTGAMVLGEADAALVHASAYGAFAVDPHVSLADRSTLKRLAERRTDLVGLVTMSA